MEKSNKIFLSHSYADTEKARNLMKDLSEFKFQVFSDTLIDPGDNWKNQIQFQVDNSNFLLILFTPKLLHKGRFTFEYSDEFFAMVKKKNIYLYPVLLEPCNIPSNFEEFDLFDLTEYPKNNSQFISLANRIQNVSNISFNDFTAHRFENLVYDLLVNLKFKNIERFSQNIDNMPVDFIGELYRESAWGIKEKETWVIETKFYNNERFNINTLNKIVSQYKYISRKNAKLLLITNSNLNSIAENFLEEIKDTSLIDVTMLDGFKLKNIIAKNPAIVEKYFHHESN